jgi:tetratricopeptide (TPR) repeat protein
MAHYRLRSRRPYRRVWAALGVAGLAAGVGVTALARMDDRLSPAAGAPAPSVAAAAHEERASSPVDGWVAAAQRGARENPRDPAAFRTLAIAFMRKQRECGDPAYYARAMAAVGRSLELEPGSYESRKLKAWVLAGQHRFLEARELARQCIARQPGDSWNYGVLADALMELGDYPAAVDAVQRMIDRKPDLASYSRAARLRELHGDPEGALQLLDLALDTTSSRDPEAAAWVRVQRGSARLGMGDPRGADAEYQRALAAQPGYHLALAGRARCQTLLRNRRQAVRLYEQALAVVPRPDWAIALGELRQLLGDQGGATAEFAVARAAMAASGGGADTDRQMALFLADHGSAEAALKHARRAARSRHDISTWDALAWALFKNGRHAEAWEASLRARRLGTKDAAMLRHAAQIAARVPATAWRSVELLRQAQALEGRQVSERSTLAHRQKKGASGVRPPTL